MVEKKLENERGKDFVTGTAGLCALLSRDKGECVQTNREEADFWHIGVRRGRTE